MSPSSFWHRHQGFTVVELIVVIVVVGILAATVLPRFSGSTGFEERGFHDSLISALRYAQKTAISARLTACATFSTSPVQVSFRVSSVQGASNCSTGTDLVLPGASTNVLAPQRGNVTFSSAPASVIFDSAGRPAVAASIGISGLTAAQNIIVEAETGYVH